MRAVWALICVAGLATHATAESEADAMFRRGRELIASGQLVEACEAFAASQRERPRVATLLNLADCFEQRGMIANARETFVQARVLAHDRGDTRREAEAERRIVALEPRIATPLTSVTPVVASVTPPSVSTSPSSNSTTPDIRAVVVPSEKARRLAIGVIVGMNVQHESLLFGARLIGSMPAPGGTIRVIGGFQLSRYNDEPALPSYTTRTFSFSGSVDYLWMPRPTFALGGGLGLGVDYDSVSPVIHSSNPDMERMNDLGSFFAVRATPISLRLRDGAIEVGLHLATLVAADEKTFTALFAADWFVW